MAWNSCVKVLPYAECGPPWIWTINGYFFAASNEGGFWIQAWIFLPSKLVYQNSSGSVSVRLPNSASLKDVSFLGVATPSMTNTSPTCVGVEMTIAKRVAPLLAV